MDISHLRPLDHIERDPHVVVLFETTHVADFRPQAVILYFERDRPPEHFQLMELAEAIELVSRVAELLPEDWQRTIDRHSAVTQRGPLDASTAWFAGPELLGSQV